MRGLLLMHNTFIIPTPKVSVQQYHLFFNPVYRLQTF
jgi:hypothetical protein